MIRRNILLFHNAALGDFVVTWPLAVACGRLLPQSRVIYVTAGQKGQLAEHILGVESVDIESGFSSLWAGPEQVPPAAARMLAGAAWVFSFVSTEQDTWTQSVRHIAPEAAIAHLATKPSADFAGHVSQFIAAQLQRVQPAIASAMGQMIDALSRRGFSARPSRRDGVVIHPGSGAEHKNWHRERFIELAKSLQAEGIAVRVVLGEVEIAKWGTETIEAFKSVASIVQPQSLVDLARTTAEACVVVCNDSGPGHLAASLGLHTVALFGPTSNPTHWRPAGPHVHLITASSLDALSVQDVLAAVRHQYGAAREAVAARSAPVPSSDE